jgi:hypothetical protein
LQRVPLVKDIAFLYPVLRISLRIAVTKIAVVTAEIDSLNTVIASLPDGPTKTEVQNRKVKGDTGCLH